MSHLPLRKDIIDNTPTQIQNRWFYPYVHVSGSSIDIVSSAEGRYRGLFASAEGGVSNPIVEFSAAHVKHIKHLLLFMCVIISFCEIKGQPLHIVPPTLYSIESSIELLKIEQKKSNSYAIVIQDNTFYIVNSSDGASSVFPLGNKSIQDLCNMVNQNLKGELVLSTGYPHIDATRLRASSNSETTSASTPVIIYPEKVKPNVAIDFGVLSSLNDPNENTNNGAFLSQTGFNLDLLGFHKFNVGNRSGLYTTLRIGFASNLNLVVNDSTGTTNASGQIELAIRLANQANLSGQIEFTPECLSFEDEDFQLGIYFDCGLTYAKLKPIDLTNEYVLYNGKYFNISDTFSINAIENYKNESNKVFPMGHLEVGLNFRFQKDKKLIFYGGIGLINRPILERGFRFNKLDNGIIDRDRLFFSLREDHGLSMRPKIGLRLANIIDIRAEAIYAISNYAIDRDNPNNLFRILIARDFPIKN